MTTTLKIINIQRKCVRGEPSSGMHATGRTAEDTWEDNVCSESSVCQVKSPPVRCVPGNGTDREVKYTNSSNRIMLSLRGGTWALPAIHK